VLNEVFRFEQRRYNRLPVLLELDMVVCLGSCFGYA
jgi:hypothetical protein